MARVDGIDTSTGKNRPLQLGTYASQRSALAGTRGIRAEGLATERGTVAWTVRRYVTRRTDITENAREQYEWVIPHIESGLGAIPLARLDRDDVSRWIEPFAASIEVDAVDDHGPVEVAGVLPVALPDRLDASPYHT